MSPLREGGVTRPEWAPQQSSGWFDDQIIRAANWWRARTARHEENRMAKHRNPLDPAQHTESDRKFFALRDSGYRGPITENGEKATKDNTDPRLWEAIQTPFQSADDYRS